MVNYKEQKGFGNKCQKMPSNIREYFCEDSQIEIK